MINIRITVYTQAFNIQGAQQCAQSCRCLRRVIRTLTIKLIRWDHCGNSTTTLDFFNIKRECIVRYKILTFTGNLNVVITGRKIIKENALRTRTTCRTCHKSGCISSHINRPQRQFQRAQVFIIAHRNI